LKFNETPVYLDKSMFADLGLVFVQYPWAAIIHNGEHRHERKQTTPKQH